MKNNKSVNCCSGVSIVVPIYNVENYLEKCIHSLIVQTYKDIEIILVDDGSNDSSNEICDHFSKIDNRIKVLHKKNGGLGFARNSGLELVTKDYVSFVDADDYLEIDAIEKLVEEVLTSGADTVIGSYTRVDNNDVEVFREYQRPEKFIGKDVLTLFVPRLLGGSAKVKDSIRPSVWNALYSMSIIKENDILFPSEREYIAEDIIFDIKYYQYSKSVSMIESTGYMYRVNPGSLTRVYREDRYKKVEYLYDHINSEINQLKLGKEAKERATKQFFVYLRVCLLQECTNTKMNFSAKLANIRKICKSSFLKKMIANYPIHSLPFKQLIFIYMVKHQLAFFLYWTLSVWNVESKA